MNVEKLRLWVESYGSKRLRRAMLDRFTGWERQARAEQRIALLFERMTMIYGHKFPSSYGTADDGTWLNALADLTDDQIAIGLEKCRTSGDEWPPTLPIFRERCLPKVMVPYHKTFSPALPSPPLSQEQIDRRSAELMALKQKFVSGARKYEMRKPDPVKPFNDDEFEALRHT